MKRSKERILTTHTGSLPRRPDLLEMLLRREEGQPVDDDKFEALVRAAVGETVLKQADAGVDVLNDGEQGKPGYTVYVKDRLTGFEGEEPAPRPSREAVDFPEYFQRRTRGRTVRRPACTGPVAWKNRDAVDKDIVNLKAALEGVNAEEVFMTAASPGNVASYHKNRYYGSDEEYLFTMADVLKEEYDAIIRAGFLLQVDCPDLTTSRRKSVGAESGGVESRPKGHPAGPSSNACLLGETPRGRITWTFRFRRSSTSCSGPGPQGCR